MLALKKIITYIKNYWYVPFVVAAGIFVLLFLQKKDNTFLDLYKQARQQNKDDVDALEKNHAKGLKARQQAQADALKKIERIEKEYEASKQNLDTQKQKEVEKLLKKAKKNPKLLADELSKLLDFKVIEIKD